MVLENSERIKILILKEKTKVLATKIALIRERDCVT